MTEGIICIDKQQDWTSFDVVAKCRRLAGCRKAGHGGTLDPMATGVLPLFFGRATRAIDLAPAQEKRYTASFCLGITTDTQDVWGTTLTRQKADVSREALLAALGKFTGELDQLPPMYSAVQVNGQRLYDLARKGVEVERQPRRVTVFSAELLDYDEAAGAGSVDIRCSKGTYVRTLLHDMGALLGCGAAMSALRRTETLGFTLDDCVTVAELETMAEAGTVERAVIPVERLFASYPAVTLDEAQVRLFRAGAVLDIGRLREAPPCGVSLRALDESGAFLGLARGVAETAELILIRQF